MDFHAALAGYGPDAETRLDRIRAIMRVGQALTRLDVEVAQSPARLPWQRIQIQAGLAAAAMEAGGSASLEHILTARIGAQSLPRHHVAMSDLNARAQIWRLVAQRKGAAHLRKLVTRLVPDRGNADLCALVGHVADALGDCAGPSWHWDWDTKIVLDPGPLDQPDVGDLAMALPYALRRAGLVTQLMPGLTSRPRLLVRQGHPLEVMGLWLTALEKQVAEGATRLHQLERHLADVEAKLSDVRRPAALRRLVAVSLTSWGVWAAQLARATGVEVSSAWRTLEQGAEMGLVVPVSTGRRSRGDAQLYAAPPWMRMAGLITGQRGRPAARSKGQDARGGSLTSAIADLNDAIESTDRLLARSAQGPS
jgi:hypothetical protein